MALNDPSFDELTGAFVSWFTSPDRQRAGTRLGPDPAPGPDTAPTPAEQYVAISDKRAEGRGRAVIALRDIEPDTTLFTVSHSDILSLSTSGAQGLVGPDETLAPWLACVLALIYEHGRGAEGKWWPYLSILPGAFDTLMHWSDDELRELQGSHVVSKIGREGAEAAFEAQLWPIVRANADKFGTHAAVFADPDESKALQALFELAHRFATLVMAYAFDLDRDDETGLDADKSMDEDGFVEDTAPPKGMVPFADMLNAEGELNNARLFHDETSVSMVSIKPIAAGTEVFNDYESLPNAEILRCYGYVASAYDQYDVVEIETERLAELAKTMLGFSEKQVQKRLDLADRWDVLDESFDLTRQPDGEKPLDHALQLTLMLLTADDEAYKQLKQTKTPPKFEAVEKIATLLIQAVTQRQSDYATTIAQDTALLQSGSGSMRQKMAIKVRLGEKEILAQNLAQFRNWLDASMMNKQSKENGSANKKARR